MYPISSFHSYRVKYIGIKCTLILLILICYGQMTHAQQAVRIQNDSPHTMLSFGQIDVLEDAKANLNFSQVISKEFQYKFRSNTLRIPKNDNPQSAYWYRFKIKHNQERSKQWILEFFDQSISELTLFAPDGSGKYKANYYGTNYNFSKRGYDHKNFIYDLNNHTNQTLTYYLRIKSPHSVSTIIVLRDLRWFVSYALGEYLLFGLFYGMIAVFCLYNLLMYFAVKGKQYLFYVLYNLSIGMYEMCNDGIAFQYLWPTNPHINVYGFGISLFLSSIFGLLFTSNFLYLKSKSPFFYKLVILTIVLRSIFFIACLIYTPLFNFKIIEFIPLLVAFSAGISVLSSGYKPASFLVIGYGFLVAGFVLKILLLLKWIPYGTLTYYSLSICFVVEMILVSFAIGNAIRTLRKKKSRVQKRIIEQLRINDDLHQNLNEQLQVLVDERTQEIQQKTFTIEKQNAEISVMNRLLKKDISELHLNIEKVTRARVMQKGLDFEEFSRIYPDKDSCFRYLSELKWSHGYACRRCQNTQHSAGQTAFSRRCTKCGYDESAIANTILQNSKIPINKALYMFILIYTSKGTISSYKLSEILNIRQSTCWTYNSKMQKLLLDKKALLKKNSDGDWGKLLLDPSVA
ncbi:7TM diverse intracellular signaling domain-containing protein [Pedobacter mendelii]|uniref:7TM diverse intracellular signaling domain-containing protein n=1 Tax=Pedobacter mendelii TaxID=1908240 RepID=UPI00166CE63E|nr:7TM diverse intracellular signaling domain-containing protein [Pedobacter mendelii]